MARGDLLCPICGQILGLPVAALRPGSVADVLAKDVGNHCHVAVDGDFTCVNAHRWRITGDLILERVS